MSNPVNDSEQVLMFCRNSKGGSLVAIRHEAQEAGIHVTDEQIRRLILVPRAQEQLAFDIEVYKRHL